MGPRGIAIAFALLFVLSLLVVPPPARAFAPTISNVTWTPWVPAHLENFTIEANIESPGGPPQVFAPVCTVPSFICVPHEMTDPDGDGRYATPQINAPDERFTGVYFNVTAVDPGGNFSFTEKIYVQVAGVISVAATLTPSSVFPGESVEIRGGADYESNLSAPAKFSRVDFRILEIGTTWSTVTDGSGTFVSRFTAPVAIGSYAINVTVSNRTITGSRERFLVVATAPTPDLALRSNSLSIDPQPARARDLVTVSFAVENRGDAGAGAFTVTVAIKDSSGNAAYTREFPMNGMAVGGQAGLSTTWTATEGAWIVTLIVDSGQQVSELSEENNRAGRALTVSPGPQEGPSATLMVGLVMAGVGVAAAVAFAYRWRARRRNSL